MQRLEGRVALVTGAASGIGKATAHRLAPEGCAVVVTDIADEAGRAVAQGIVETGGGATYVHHDVSSETDWDAAVDVAMAEFGRLDILLNNAGMGDLAARVETATYLARCHPRQRSGSAARDLRTLVSHVGALVGVSWV